MNPLRGIWHWLTSRNAREAVDQHRVVRRLLAFQRDRLPAEGVAEVQAALDAVARSLRHGASLAAVEAATANLLQTAHRWLVGVVRRPHREICEILILAAVVVLGLRTFFFQPMKIPTGSMQPTLYGITTEDLRSDAEAQIPSGFTRLAHRWLYGRTYYHFGAKTDGEVTSVGGVEPIFPWLPGLPFLRKQVFVAGGTRYTLWFPPTELPNRFGIDPDQAFFANAGLRPRRWYRRGEDLIKFVINAGDHVLVDRFTWNFRRPRRGEIMVFRTSGIQGLQESTHYMKRLVAVGGERVKIGNDRHLVVNGVRLDAHTPGFEKVYNFDGPPRDSEYSGHLNDFVAQRNRIPRGTLAPRFPDGQAEFTVRPRHCLVMGDNTVSSLDGRRWGDFPQTQVLGRFWMVYWPISARIGWGTD